MFFKKSKPIKRLLIFFLFLLQACTSFLGTKPDDKQTHVVVVIDVFRASTTAAYTLEKQPATYIFATESVVLERLRKQFKNPFLIGKPEKGVELIYDIPNSPTRVLEHNIKERVVMHRTAAGAKGTLEAKDADIILMAGFVNAGATAEYIKSLKSPKVTMMPMGHEATTPSLEDDLCAEYIDALIKGKKMNIDKYKETLKTGTGSYFFKEDQAQYPMQDFDRSLEIDRFNFIIMAKVKDNYAVLTRVDQ